MNEKISIREIFYLDNLRPYRAVILELKPGKL